MWYTSTPWWMLSKLYLSICTCRLYTIKSLAQFFIVFLGNWNLSKSLQFIGFPRIDDTWSRAKVHFTDNGYMHYVCMQCVFAVSVKYTLGKEQALAILTKTMCLKKWVHMKWVTLNHAPLFTQCIISIDITFVFVFKECVLTSRHRKVMNYQKTIHSAGW